jgi:hypothetical protein
MMALLNAILNHKKATVYIEMADGINHYSILTEDSIITINQEIMNEIVAKFGIFEKVETKTNEVFIPLDFERIEQHLYEMDADE